MGDLFRSPRIAHPLLTNILDPMSRHHVSRDKLCTFLILRHRATETVGSYEDRAKKGETKRI